MNLKTTFYFLAFLMLAYLPQRVAAQGDTFYVSGNHIYDPCGTQFIPRGVDYSVLDDWDFPGSDLTGEIKQANPNVVRITWWRTYSDPTRPGYALSDLDTVVSRFERAGIVSIVALVDETGGNDSTMFRDSIVNWWTSAPVVALVHKHRKAMIVNIENEWGSVAYMPDPAAAMATYEAVYEHAITSLRGAGITTPLLIDGPDYAVNADEIATAGPVLEAADPMHNIIMSVHAYWATSSECASNDTTAIRNQLNTLHALSVPVMVGETANWAPSCDGATQCAYPINIGFLLTVCKENEMGWLDWEWYDDCDTRVMTTAGTYASLTGIGDSIVNNPTFGLMANAVKTPYMMNGETCASTLVNNETKPQNAPLQVLTDNEGRSILQINDNGPVRITDMYGKTVWEMNGTAGNRENIYQFGLPKGMYIITQYSNITGTYAVKAIL